MFLVEFTHRVMQARQPFTQEKYMFELILALLGLSTEFPREGW